MADVVLDASAVLALNFEEPGAETVAKHLPVAAICTVNLAEVTAKLADLGMPEKTVASIVNSLRLDAHPLDIERAFESSRLRSCTRKAGLSLRDRACLALAKRLGVPALTTDRVWAHIGKDAGVTSELLR